MATADELGTGGTPPRVWGKLLFYPLTIFSYRYTPTCVGKTDVTYTPENNLKVHPHVCGENAC